MSCSDFGKLDWKHISTGSHDYELNNMKKVQAVGELCQADFLKIPYAIYR